MPKLNAADMKTISAALSDAIRWRDSLADAYHRTGPDAAAATMAVERYERLHVKLTGQPSAVAAETSRFGEMKKVSIFELGEKP